MKRSKRTLPIFLSNLYSSLIISLFGKSQSGNNNSMLIVNTEKLGDINLSADFMTTLKEKNEFDSYYIILDKKYGMLFDWVKAGYTCIPLNKARYKYDLIYRLNFILGIRGKRFKKVINLAPERGMINEEIVLTSGSLEKVALKDASIFLNRYTLRRNNKKYNYIFHSGELNEYNRMMNYAGGTGERRNIISIKPFRHPSNDNHNYIVIAPMASEMDRTWGLNNYKELIKHTERSIILLGNESEKEILDELAKENHNIINLAGMVTINEAAFIIQKARLFIGNDSGLTHLAHYLDVPLIAIIGGGKHNIFFPYREREDSIFLFNKLDCFNCNWFCKYDRMKCFDISVEQVQNTIESLYANR